MTLPGATTLTCPETGKVAFKVDHFPASSVANVSEIMPHGTKGLIPVPVVARVEVEATDVEATDDDAFAVEVVLAAFVPVLVVAAFVDPVTLVVASAPPVPDVEAPPPPVGFVSSPESPETS